LMNDWVHVQDSLSAWNISNAKNSPQMKWVLAKFNGRTAEAKALEGKILGRGNESIFHLFSRAIELVEGERKRN
ncbi:MAG: hypothetical protein M3015_15470, partial [Bacteroidota bacterium]|nr:hypothetical protein [Bacteroidota bacterium]